MAPDNRKPERNKASALKTDRLALPSGLISLFLTSEVDISLGRTPPSNHSDNLRATPPDPHGNLSGLSDTAVYESGCSPMTTRAIKNPKELLDFLFADPDGFDVKPAKPGVHSFDPQVDFAAQLEANFERLREIARKTILKAGLDPAQARKIARERGTADAVFWAAQMLNELDHIQQYLIRVGQSDLEEALGAVLSSLAFAGLYHAFTVANEEPSIVAGFGSRHGAPKSGQARADKSAPRERQMAEEFHKRQQARDLAAGAIVGAPRPSDIELKRQIGAEHGLAKTAAIDAIDRGLAILNGVAATPH
jgi:hypothetical protein